MKKLRLNFTQSVGEILTREELKSITGGDLGGSGTWGVYLPSNAPVNTGSYHGSFHAVGGSGKTAYETFDGSTIIRGVNKETALAMIDGQSGAKWCCDSCGSASWY
ncbi:hypothetical protein [Hoylesella oralis]|uniref:hypothetical protein n=1 Tax=Hoylesella oralis TaxID=28134 RepID=UPI0028E55305|nr:hypothetical protein [Hoylesella oralis]